MRCAILLAGAVMLVSAAPAPAAGGGATSPCALAPAERPGTGRVLRVPSQYQDVHAAVAAAHPSDTILIKPGDYPGGILVDKPGLRIRGTDRDGVVIDGRGPKRKAEIPSLAGFGFQVTADRVMIENLTLRYFQHEGIVWRSPLTEDGTVKPIRGFWGRYITVTGAGHAGVVAAGTECGQLDHIVATGGVIGGISVQGCGPCRILVTDSVLKENAIGVLSLDVGSDLHIEGNVIEHNQVGALPGLEDPVHIAAQDPATLTHSSRRGAVIRHNAVVDNGIYNWPDGICEGAEFPCRDFAIDYNGTGIFMFGPRATHVEDNYIARNKRFGIQLAGFVSAAVGNVIRFNTLDANGFQRAGWTWTGADLYQDSVVGPGNCYQDNQAPVGQSLRTEPPELQRIWSCRLPTTPAGGMTFSRTRCAQWLPTPEAVLRGEAPDSCWTAAREPPVGSGPTSFMDFPVPTDARATEDAPDEPVLEEWLPQLVKALSP